MAQYLPLYSCLFQTTLRRRLSTPLSTSETAGRSTVVDEDDDLAVAVVVVVAVGMGTEVWGGNMPSCGHEEK